MCCNYAKNKTYDYMRDKIMRYKVTNNVDAS